MPDYYTKAENILQTVINEIIFFVQIHEPLLCFGKKRLNLKSFI